jgi:GDSL-like Lipase/Acylhydrolase family
MRGPRFALIAGLAALAAVAAGCGAGGSTSGPNQGSAIVSIGDSVASGEGNPNPSGPRWENRACHRSSIAGQTFAAEEAQKKHPELGFFNYSCSGAGIVKGLLHPYKGIEPAVLQPARPQVDQVADAAELAKGSGGLAALEISIGANDVGFSKILKFCALVTKCPQAHFNPGFPYAEASASHPTLQQYVSTQLADLPSEFSDLNLALKPLIPANRVIIVDYFDPTTGPGGAACRMLFGGVTPEESRWAQQQVLEPLNAQIEAAAKAHGWNAVTGVAERFRGHGICAPDKQRWVHTLGEGLTGREIPLNAGARPPEVRSVIETSAGTLHPNEEGHRQLAALIEPVLERVLNQ